MREIKFPPYQTIRASCQNKIEELFGIDSRALVVFRISLALVSLADLATRLPDLKIFYTDAGVLPRADVLDFLNKPWTISLHFMGGSPLSQAILFSLHILCAIGLLVGYRTRLMTVLVWFFTLSLHNRAQLVLGGGDDYLRQALFWSMFLPLGLRFSVDRALNPSKDELPIRILTWGTAAFLIQNALIYLIAAGYKWHGPTWRGEGSAIYYVLNLDMFARRPAQWLLLFPQLTKWMTHGVLGFELIGSLLLFSPVFTGMIRTLTAFGFILMQVGFGSCMYLIIFPRISIVCLLVFLPTGFWDKLSAYCATGTLARVRNTWRRQTAAQRHILSRIGSRMERYPIAVKQSKLESFCTLFFLLLVLYSALTIFQSSRIKIPPLPEPLKTICQTLRVNQEWSMFAPGVFKNSGWLVIPGKLKNGADVDVFKGGAPLTWIKPANVLSTFKSERWREYLTLTFLFDRNQKLWPAYGDFMCRSWNAEHSGDEQLTSFNVNIMERTTPPEDQVGIYHRIFRTHFDCFRPTTMPFDTINRSPAFAGNFYPSDPSRLRQTVDRLIAHSNPPKFHGQLVALLVPHAGFGYSGAVAAAGFKRIGRNWDTVIMLGTAHHAYVRGAALWARGTLSTPLGPVPVDEAMAGELLKSSPLFEDSVAPHEKEHSLEVELPFLQRTLGSFKIVPLLMSNNNLAIAEGVGEAIARVARGRRVLILISSDLSHYADSDTARRVDDVTLESLKRLDARDLALTCTRQMDHVGEKYKTVMCGQAAVQTGIYAAKLLGANDAVVLNYANSGSILNLGDPARVVGYASVAFVRKSQ